MTIAIRVIVEILIIVVVIAQLQRNDNSDEVRNPNQAQGFGLVRRLGDMNRNIYMHMKALYVFEVQGDGKLRG